MIWLTEDPAPVLILGTLTAVLLAAIWWQSGQRFLLYSAVTAALLTVIGLLVEQWIVTPREEVSATLQQIAQDVESNDVSAMVTHLHSTLGGLRTRASQEMSRYEFQDVKIKNNLQVVVFENEQPPRATAEFNVVVIGSDRSGMMQNRRVPRFMQVTFLREDGAWRVSDYAHADPRRGLLRQDAPHRQY